MICDEGETSSALSNALDCHNRCILGRAFQRQDFNGHAFAQLLKPDFAAGTKAKGITITVEFRTDLREHRGFFGVDPEPAL